MSRSRPELQLIDGGLSEKPKRDPEQDDTPDFSKAETFDRHRQEAAREKDALVNKSRGRISFGLGDSSDKRMSVEEAKFALLADAATELVAPPEEDDIDRAFQPTDETTPSEIVTRQRRSGLEAEIQGMTEGILTTEDFPKPPKGHLETPVKIEKEKE